MLCGSCGHRCSMDPEDRSEEVRGGRNDDQAEHTEEDDSLTTAQSTGHVAPAVHARVTQPQARSAPNLDATDNGAPRLPGARPKHRSSSLTHSGPVSSLVCDNDQARVCQTSQSASQSSERTHSTSASDVRTSSRPASGHHPPLIQVGMSEFSRSADVDTIRDRRLAGSENIELCSHGDKDQLESKPFNVAQRGKLVLRLDTEGAEAADASAETPVLDSPDDSSSQIVDFIEADIARVYLQSSNSSRGSSLGDLCDTNSSGSSAQHDITTNGHRYQVDSDDRQADRPDYSQDGECFDYDDSTLVPKRKRDKKGRQKNCSPVPNSALMSARPSSGSLDYRGDLEYLELDMDMEQQFSPEYLHSASSESNLYTYSSSTDDKANVTEGEELELGNETIGGACAMGNNPASASSDSSDVPRGRDAVYRRKIFSGQARNIGKGSCHDPCNNLNEGSSSLSNDNSDELFNVSRQTSTSNFDQDENSFQESDSASEYPSVSRVHTENRCLGAEAVLSHDNTCRCGLSDGQNQHYTVSDHSYAQCPSDYVWSCDGELGHHACMPMNNHDRFRRLTNEDFLLHRANYIPRSSRSRQRDGESPDRNFPLLSPPVFHSHNSEDHVGAAHLRNICEREFRLRNGHSDPDLEGPVASLNMWSPQSNPDETRSELRYLDCRRVSDDVNGARSKHNRGPPSLGSCSDDLEGVNPSHLRHLMDLHLATQEQWDEYMGVTRGLPNSRSFHAPLLANVSVVRPLSPTLSGHGSHDGDSSWQGHKVKDESCRLQEAHGDLGRKLLHESEVSNKKERSSCGLRSQKLEKVMLWSEYEAYLLQVKQIGASACGPTAVINILKGLNIYVDKEAVCQAIKTNLRAENAPLPEYLLSRSVAGTTAHTLMEGVETLTQGKVRGKFFDFFPRRSVDIREWLAYWIRRGAVPLLTLNLQQAVPAGWKIPDAWHHQMAYGVSSKGVFLTNPLEVVPASMLHEQLCSDSVLLVRRQDVVTRWNETCDLSVLINQTDPRWRNMNVVGQVVNVMREQHMTKVPGYRPHQTSHIQIPAVYKAGITLFAKVDSEVYIELLKTPQLPIRKEKYMETAV